MYDGPGNDVVDARGAAGPIDAYVDVGNDVIRGSRFADQVHEVRRAGQPADGADTVYLGAGNDRIGWTASGGRDRVELGPGNDDVSGWSDRSSPIISVGGSDGRDSFTWRGPRDSWSVHMAQGVLRSPSAQQVEFGGFETYDLSDLGSCDAGEPDRSNRLEVTGTGRDDVVDLGTGFKRLGDDFCDRVSRTVNVDLGAGDDSVEARANDGGRIVGGPGTDRVLLTGAGDLHGAGDLAADRFVTTRAPNGADPDYRRVLAISGWEAVRVGRVSAVTLLGNGGPNTLGVAEPTYGAVRFDGRGGDDVLVGGRADDTLTGGDGTDSADGNGGTDTCDAETTTACEP